MATIKRIGKDNFGIPIWQVRYRRTAGGKQVMRHVHAATKADAEREVLLDSDRSDVNLRWSEGVKIYLDAKMAENRSPEAMGHVDRAVRIFIEIMGDIPIEKTTAAAMKQFMQKVVVYPIVNKKTGKELRKSGPKVANHHRKEMLTVARYLRNYTEKVTTIPFEHVHPLPIKVEKRQPVPPEKVHAYLDALPVYLDGPLRLVLFYGLRSTAICNLTPESVDGDVLIAIDKGNVKRRIPIDAMLRGILERAEKYRSSFPNPDDRLFVNLIGRKWDRMSLLRSANRAWKKAGLEERKIHEFRHTLGTMAGKFFEVGMVQAAMGHKSRKSSETYFHPDEDMAAEVRGKIITVLSQTDPKTSSTVQSSPTITYTKDGVYECPCCRAKLLISKKKGRKSK